jgi:hypothetical protein
MAVTLYRCSKCRGVFNSVWDTPSGRLCRDCKLQILGYQTQGGKPAVEQVKIVEDIMGGGKAGAAIGGNIGDAESLFEQQAYQQSPQSLNVGLAGTDSDERNLANEVYFQQLQEDRLRKSQEYRFTFSGFKDSPPRPVAKPEPESSPHDAILKPSRKLKLAAE